MIIQSLKSLSRLALAQIGPCRSHVPTSGLQIITGLVPLHLKARMKNFLTLLRLSNFDFSSVPDSNNHLGVLKKDIQ